ncbi:MAG: helix-turn-helix domain-containing protein, partial [Thermoanaerobaculia bacterium]
TKGNVSRAAERLGLDRTTLHRKMKALGLDGE